MMESNFDLRSDEIDSGERTDVVRSGIEQVRQVRREADLCNRDRTILGTRERGPQNLDRIGGVLSRGEVVWVTVIITILRPSRAG